MKVIGGLLLSDSFVVTWPLIEFEADGKELVFRARFGLGRLLGPWRLERAEVRRISRTPRRSVMFGVEFWGSNSRWVLIGIGAKSGPVLHHLAELGYPVDCADSGPAPR